MKVGDFISFTSTSTVPRTVPVTRYMLCKKSWINVSVKNMMLEKGSNTYFEKAFSEITSAFMYIYIIYIQLFLIFHRFYICEFTHMLKFICNLKIGFHSTFTVLHRHARSSKKFDLPDTRIPRWSRTRWYFAFLFLLSSYEHMSFHWCM